MVYKKIVVKVGSSVIAPGGKINSTRVKNIIDAIVDLDKRGVKTVLVSSGAIACGLALLEYKKRPQEIHSLMALASLGQVLLMGVYNQKLKKHKKLCGQVLLTWDDFNERKRYLNARCTIEKLWKLGVIPIINENDAISSDEIKFGDNDKLSALVGDLIGANLLCILSNVQGVFSHGTLINVVEHIDSSIIQCARREKSEFTTGGMVTKIEAAKIATQAGITTVIANGKIKGIITKIVEGKHLGTVFLPHKALTRAKKRWIAFGKKVRGRIYVDKGAKEALMERGKSLLACGIIKVEGQFLKHDAVEVVDAGGYQVGRGLIEYASADLIGARTKYFEREVIHRNNFVKSEP